MTSNFARMARRTLLGSALALATTLAAGPLSGRTPAPPPARLARPPNIVVILADDMGFSDLSSYGSEIPTPNIDALSAGGIRFTQFYNTARCSPSRASLLTGLYPHEAGMGHLETVAKPGSRGTFGKLAERAVTMAEVLRNAGYFTGMAGKWHLGISHGVGPWQRGFDRSIASPTGGIYFPDQPEPGARKLFIDGVLKDPASSEIGQGHWYSPDLFVDWSTRFFKEAEAKNKPFFLYLPFVNVHWPLMAPPEDIARFKGKYMVGWDVLRQQRFARQKQMGLLGQDETFAPRLPQAYDWNRVPQDQRERFDTMMAIYAATVSRMDRAVGTLVARLKAAGELDNTLILFLADNGGNAEGGPDGRTENPPLGSAKSTVWAGLNWATLMNTPFSYFKHYTEEGGISTPLIAYWPKGIDPRLNGSFQRDPGHLIDVMATVVDVTGATYPTSHDGHAILPMEGRSFASAFRGGALSRSVPIYWEHEGNRAVRDGKWKIVSRFQEPWELYDMTSDRGETRDLAATNAGLVTRMAQQWDAWAARSFVDPWGDKLSGGVFRGVLDGGRPRGRAAQGAPPRARPAQTEDE